METLTYMKAILLGLVQGLAEFLPISSSGHLSLLQYFFGIEGESVLIFAVLLHMGSLIAVFVVYGKDFIELFAELGRTIKDVCTGKGLQPNKNETRKLGCMIVVATIPTAIIGYFFNDFFTSLYNSIIAIGIALIITGTLLYAAQRVGRDRNGIQEMNYRNAVFIGVMQGLAVTPGISRSGSTLFGGLFINLKKEFAVKFAFLISMPSILGSFVLELPGAIEMGMQGVAIGPILAGMLAAAISGYVAIKLMIRVVVSNKLTFFSGYTWVLGTIVVIYGLFFA